MVGNKIIQRVAQILGAGGGRLAIKAGGEPQHLAGKRAETQCLSQMNGQVAFLALAAGFKLAIESALQRRWIRRQRDGIRWFGRAERRIIWRGFAGDTAQQGARRFFQCFGDHGCESGGFEGAFARVRRAAGIPWWG